MPPDYTEYSAIEQVINAEIIWNHFGYWPNFHDAEIIKVVFETHQATWRYSITFTVDAWETTNTLTPQGHYEQTKRCLIDIQLTGIRELDFEYFTVQNVL